jgi:hypothetical protein
MQQIGEGQLDIPADWHNQSINIYTAQPPGSPGVSVSVNRDRLPYGATLQEYAHAQTGKLMEQLNNFQLVEQLILEVDAHPAHYYEFTWDSPDVGSMHQLLLCMANGPALINITTSHLGRMTPEQGVQLKAMLKSFRFNPPVAPSTATAR